MSEITSESAMSDNGHDELALRDAWFKRAKETKTLDDLCAFYQDLFGGKFQHEYGTICRAIAAFGYAAMCVADKSDQGGITGFQASCIQWDFMRAWNSWEKDAAYSLIRWDDALYPQYAHRFGSIRSDVLEGLREKACKMLDENLPASPNVIAHWRFLVNGGVPFGLRVESAK